LTADVRVDAISKPRQFAFRQDVLGINFVDDHIPMTSVGFHCHVAVQRTKSNVA